MKLFVIFLICVFGVLTIEVEAEVTRHTNGIRKTSKNLWVTLDESERDFFDTLTEEEKFMMQNGVIKPVGLVPDPPIVSSERRTLPEDFIFYDKWPECDNRQPFNQGGCGDCWIAATSNAVSDRFCVEHAKAGRDITWFADGPSGTQTATQVMASCFNEQHPTQTSKDVCGGGWMADALQVLIDDAGQERGAPLEQCWKYCPKDDNNPSGYVGCKGYTGALYTCPVDGTKGASFSCPGTGGTSGWASANRLYVTNKNYVGWNHQTVMQEIYDNGPLIVSFSVYSDFYPGGIYEKASSATYSGGHAVSLIGWGTEYGVPYWILKNSWGAWGEKRWTNYKGFFRFIRGTNDCGLEGGYFAPDVVATAPTCSGGCTSPQICIAPNTCGCPRGSTGGSCATPVCTPSCQNSGVCDTVGEPCNCAASGGYFGYDCTHFKCTTECVNGVCDAPDHCDCNTAWQGALCDQWYCPTQTCNNGGYCNGPDTCQCVGGWTGADCTGFSCSQCLHGSTCIGPDLCDCSTTTGNLVYSGNDCSYAEGSADITPSAESEKKGEVVGGKALDGGQVMGVVSGSLAAAFLVLVGILACCCCLLLILFGIVVCCCVVVVGVLGGAGGVGAGGLYLAKSGGDEELSSSSVIPEPKKKPEEKKQPPPKKKKIEVPMRNVPIPKKQPPPPRKKIPMRNVNNKPSVMNNRNNLPSRNNNNNNRKPAFIPRSNNNRKPPVVAPRRNNKPPMAPKRMNKPPTIPGRRNKPDVPVKKTLYKKNKPPQVPGRRGGRRGGPPPSVPKRRF